MSKNKITIGGVITILLVFVLALGFSIEPAASGNFFAGNNNRVDSTWQNNRGGMMGRSMMGGGMMGGHGMMMGQRGMMGRGSYQRNQTDSKGNWVAPASANKLTNPLKDITEASQKGENIFNAQCFTCHGTDGKGDGPAAISLHPKPANLTSSRVQDQSDGAIFWKITNGNSPMPSFSGLTKNQRWELVDYIRQLGK